MNKRWARIILKIFAWISTGIFIVVLSAPLIVYQHALGLVDGFPQKSNLPLSEGEAAELWGAKEKCKPEQCASITPYWIYRWLSMAIINDNIYQIDTNVPYQNVSVMASRVAITYMREGHFKGKGMLWWHLTHACLGIWVQRNWSANEIASKYKQIKA